MEKKEEIDFLKAKRKFFNIVNLNKEKEAIDYYFEEKKNSINDMLRKQQEECNHPLFLGPVQIRRGELCYCLLCNKEMLRNNIYSEEFVIDVMVILEEFESISNFKNNYLLYNRVFVDLYEYLRMELKSIFLTPSETFSNHEIYNHLLEKAREHLKMISINNPEKGRGCNSYENEKGSDEDLCNNQREMRKERFN